jgi:hypothetical protein
VFFPHKFRPTLTASSLLKNLNESAKRTVLHVCSNASLLGLEHLNTEES